MHDTGAVIGRRVIRQIDGREAVKALVHMGQRVLEVQVVELFALGRGNRLAFHGPAFHVFLNQGAGHDEQTARRIDQAVFQLGIDVQRLVGRDGPGGRRPDHGKCRFVQLGQAKGGGQLLGLGRGEHHVQRLALLVLVFDFELSQRRSTVKAPVHGLEATVDKTALHHLLQGAQFQRLVGVVHGLVRVIPVTQHTQALEVDHLLGNLLSGEGAALGLHFVARQIAAMQLFDGVFDGQTVAVPARHVTCVKTFQLAALDDHVLQDLVDGVADVDLAVGIGRAVMQDEHGGTGAGSAQLLVDALVFPLLDPAWLTLGQIAAHGKRGVGHVQRAAINRCFGLVGLGIRHELP